MSAYTAKSRIHNRQKMRKLKKKKIIRRRLIILLISAIAFSLVVIGLNIGVETGKEAKYRDTYAQYIIRYSLENRLDPNLVKAVIRQESNYVADARSDAGAGGLMQLMEKTADEYGKKLGLENFDYMDPETNIKIGCFLLKSLINKYEIENTALAAYNAGMGNVDKWLENPQYSHDGKHLDYIPYSETRNYVKKINEYKDVYKKH